ncbi:hypothetical protein SNE40_020807 [Patella caerulea]|uniref:Core-binding (CB) domain-containing protein n=1 Tax=Patella caerulea TaxID=87958 RepID=A0AAN8P3R2_PATCE
MVTTSHRPIRNSVESQAPNVCLSLSGFSSMGSRRDNFELERSVRLCVSPVCSNSKGIGKGEVGKVQDPTSSTLVAEPSLDSSVVGSSLRFFKSSTDWTDNAQAASHERFSQQSHDLQPSRLALVRDRLRDESFSGTSAKRIAGAKRRSTSRVYDAKWHIFTQWCQQENIVPTKISIQRLADFFNFLFDVKSLRPSTISGYRSSISNTLKHFGRNDISTHVALTDLFQFYNRERPVVRSLTPQWSLALVLDSLTKAPYEPLRSASLKFVTLKTVFLLALASARRVSEIHAFSIDPQCFRLTADHLILLTEPGFLAKNQLPHKAPHPIKIKSLSNFDQDSAVLCPVRAVKFYLDATKVRHTACNRLFLSLKGGGVAHRNPQFHDGLLK